MSLFITNTADDLSSSGNNSIGLRVSFSQRVIKKEHCICLYNVLSSYSSSFINDLNGCVIMKIILISAVLCSLLHLLCSTAICWSATYYVDATNGNDSNPGTSESTPWKTIAKDNNSSLDPGDFVLSKRGEVWREQLEIPSSGVLALSSLATSGSLG